jgi:hypothetical protein
MERLQGWYAGHADTPCKVLGDECYVMSEQVRQAKCRWRRRRKTLRLLITWRVRPSGPLACWRRPLLL